MLSVALYDESLNLTRSVAEIANLLFLFRIKPEEYRAWVIASRKLRIQNFAPAPVRRKIQDLDAPLPISEKWYRELCETATHAVPGVRPNAHQSGSPGFVGGLFQEEGYSDCVSQLSYVLATTAIALASMFEREELIELVRGGLDAEIEYWKTQPDRNISDSDSTKA